MVFKQSKPYYFYSDFFYICILEVCRTQNLGDKPKYKIRNTISFNVELEPEPNYLFIVEPEIKLELEPEQELFNLSYRR